MAHLASSNDDAAHLRVFCSREKLDVDEPILLYAASILGGEDAEAIAANPDGSIDWVRDGNVGETTRMQYSADNCKVFLKKR